MLFRLAGGGDSSTWGVAGLRLGVRGARGMFGRGTMRASGKRDAGMTRKGADGSDNGREIIKVRCRDDGRRDGARKVSASVCRRRRRV